ncbi:MAG: ribbon-helix-helix domain-containing protein [Candidatus Diapherotrites archaeon]
MKMLSVQVEDKMASKIDALVSRSGLYSSRSEFLKDAIRKCIVELETLSDERLHSRLALRTLALTAYDRGYRGEELTREQRAKIADEFLKKKSVNTTKVLADQ